MQTSTVDGDELELAQPRHPSVAGSWRIGPKLTVARTTVKITTLQPARGHLRILVER